MILHFSFIKKIIFCTFILHTSNTYTDNKIVILLSPPRSLSVACLRMMEERGDFKVMHEPCIYPFNKLHHSERTKDWFREGAADTYEKVKHNIFEYAKTSHVFIKEMVFSFKDFIEHEQEFVTNPNIYFVFWFAIRTMVSFHYIEDGKGFIVMT